MDAADFVTETEAEEVFAVLADDTRVAILQALWETEDYEASFSELRDAVGMRDSGQFNYHLDKLVGPFVAKAEDGYE
ncbi:MAG: DNA-binding transcriptional ArsR family regulator, partial [Natronomonas sp.]